MLKKGYIEGFYGRLLDWQGRSMLLDTLSELSMDFYIYGPKEDRFLRKDWQILYPKEILEDLKNEVSQNRIRENKEVLEQLK